jgi:hypothetical protein
MYMRYIGLGIGHMGDLTMAEGGMDSDDEGAEDPAMDVDPTAELLDDDDDEVEEESDPSDIEDAYDLL